MKYLLFILTALSGCCAVDNNSAGYTHPFPVTEECIEGKLYWVNEDGKLDIGEVCE